MNLLSFFDNTAQVYVIGVDDFIKPNCIDLGDYISILSDEEKERFHRYKNEKAQFTFLTARYFLRKILDNHLSMESRNELPSRKVGEVSQNARRPTGGWECMRAPGWQASRKDVLSIETTTLGKPYLKDYPNLFFNLSHTDNLILIAIANSPIGVDVEKNERNADKEAIIKHFFSEKEQQSFFSQPEEQRQLAFVKGWTRKEAILKATGEGLSSMKNYEVSFEPETDTPIINSKSENNFIIKDFTPQDGYAACIALLQL